MSVKAVMTMSLRYEAQPLCLSFELGVESVGLSPNLW